jgi:hypothetical protein
MFPNTNNTTTAKTETKAKKPGVLFDLVEVTETTDATTGEVKKSFKNIGRVFLRENLSGGAVYVKTEKGKPDTEYSLFRSKPFPKRDAQPAAAPAQQAA